MLQEQLPFSRLSRSFLEVDANFPQRFYFLLLLFCHSQSEIIITLKKGYACTVFMESCNVSYAGHRSQSCLNYRDQGKQLLYSKIRVLSILLSEIRYNQEPNEIQIRTLFTQARGQSILMYRVGLCQDWIKSVHTTACFIKFYNIYKNDITK